MPFRFTLAIVWALALAWAIGAGACTETCTDHDEDGFCGNIPSGGCARCASPLQDCDDDDATIHPGAADPAGDGVDSNCDGRDVPEDCLRPGNEGGDPGADCEDRACSAHCAEDRVARCGAALMVDAHVDDTVDDDHWFDAFDGSSTRWPARVLALRVPGSRPPIATLSFHGAPGQRFVVTLGCPFDPFAADPSAPGLGDPPRDATTPYSFVAPVDRQTYVYVYGASGPYSLDVTYQIDACGDGVLTPPETCDDGNVGSGDGCDATCGAVGPELCAMAPTVPAGILDGDTSEQPILWGCHGHESTALYRFVPSANGSVSFALTSPTPHEVGLYGACSGAGDLTSCVASGASGAAGVLTTPSVAGVPLVFGISSYGTEAGPFEVTIVENL